MFFDGLDEFGVNNKSKIVNLLGLNNPKRLSY